MMIPLGFLGGFQAMASAVFDPFRGVTVRFLILSEGTEKCKENWYTCKQFLMAIYRRLKQLLITTDACMHIERVKYV